MFKLLFCVSLSVTFCVLVCILFCVLFYVPYCVLLFVLFGILICVPFCILFCVLFCIFLNFAFPFVCSFTLRSAFSFFLFLSRSILHSLLLSLECSLLRFYRGCCPYYLLSVRPRFPLESGFFVALCASLFVSYYVPLRAFLVLSFHSRFWSLSFLYVSSCILFYVSWSLQRFISVSCALTLAFPFVSCLSFLLLSLFPVILRSHLCPI